jgi:hypothetical protein
MKKTCCIVTIIRYDHSYLKEFIDYHSKIGVTKFIIYNNGTEIQSLKETVLLEDKYPNCVIIDFPGDVMKITAYSHFTINILKTIEEDWILFIDSNEFLVPKKHITIQKFIEENVTTEKSIGIKKKIFSTNGHINKPDNETYLNYTLSRTTSEIKTIIHKDILKKNINIKIFDNLNNILNTAEIIDDTDVICINHYLRSWSELIHKIKHHKKLESHHKYNFSEFSDDGFGLSKDCDFKRDIDIFKLLSIKNIKEPIIHENDDEEEQVNKLLNNN